MVYSAGKPEESCTRTSQSSEGNKGEGVCTWNRNRIVWNESINAIVWNENGIKN